MLHTASHRLSVLHTLVHICEYIPLSPSRAGPTSPFSTFSSPSLRERTRDAATHEYCAVGVCSAASVVSDSWPPCRLRPARLLCPWESPGKNPGVVACPPPGDLPDPGMEPLSPLSPALKADSLPPSCWGSPATGYYSAMRRMSLSKF